MKEDEKSKTQSNSKLTLITSFNSFKSASVPKKKMNLKVKTSFTPKLYERKNSDFGFALKLHKTTVVEQLKLLSKGKESKSEFNIFEDTNFPLISCVSKMNVLNNSNKLVQDLLTYNKNDMNKSEENFVIRGDKMNRSDLHTFYGTRMINYYDKKYKSIPGYKSLYNVKAEELSNLCRVKDRLKNHDTNWYNRRFLVKDYFDNYMKNSYRIQYYYKKDDFINMIKKDLTKLKYDYRIKAFTNIVKDNNVLKKY